MIGKFITYFLVSSACMLFATTVAVGGAWAALEFAMWGDAPPLPWWQMWRFVIVAVLALTFICSAFIAVLEE